ncbi:MAG: MATE family efflux transporter [Leptospiraceae bacterium]|nr:MATE family efflux transporter [Leptospiraceae bacterium]
MATLRGLQHRVARLFRSSPLNRRVWSLALPVMLSMTTFTAIMITDTAMVGRLGSEALAATSMGGTAFWTVMSLFIGAAHAIQILVARRFGEKRLFEAGNVLYTALYLAIIPGGILTAVCIQFTPELIAFLSHGERFSDNAISFLRIRFLGLTLYFIIFILRSFFDGIGRTYVGLVSAITSMAANIFMNWVFIFGHLGAPAMGADGAALASTLAGIPGILVFVPFFFGKAMQALIRPALRLPDMRVLREIVLISLPTSLSELVMNLSFLMFYKIAAMIGTNAVAATGIVVSILSVSFMPGFGFSIATMTIVGQSIARKQYRKAYHGAYRSAAYAALVMGGMACMFLSIPGPLIRLFNEDPAVVEAAIGALVLVALGQVGDAYGMNLAGALRSAGMVYHVLAVYAVASLGVLLPVAYFMGVYLQLGTGGLWSGILVWILVLWGILAYMFSGNRWQHIKI